MKALILTDIQYDFLPGGALAVEDGDKVIPIANKVQHKFDLIVATQDWHPENHGSFASNQEGKEPMDKGKLGGLDQVFWPDHCVQGSRGAELHDDLNTNKIEAIFRKGMEPEIDTYSTFFDNGHKKDTGLNAYLKGRDIDHVYVTGLAADFCVYYTLKDAVNLGYETTLIKDATRAIDKENFENNIMKELKESGVKIITSDEL